MKSTCAPEIFELSATSLTLTSNSTLVDMTAMTSTGTPSGVDNTASDSIPQVVDGICGIAGGIAVGIKSK